MKLTIRGKLLLIFGGGALLILLSAAIGFLMLWNGIRIYEDKVMTLHADAEAVLRVQTNFKKQVQEWKDVLLRGSDPAALEKYWTGFKNMERTVQEQTDTLLARTSDPGVRDLLLKFSGAHKEMGEKYEKGLNAFKDAGFESKAGDSAVKGMDRAPTELLGDAASLIQKIADDASGEAVVQSRRAIAFSLSAILLALVIAITVFQWTVRRSILKPAQELMRDLGRLAEGDFSLSVHRSSQDEIGEVAASSERVRSSLGSILTDVNRSSDALSLSSRELVATSRQVAANSDMQSEAASGAAAAVEEMTVSITSVADSAEEGRQLVAKALDDTRQGNQKLQELTECIDTVKESVSRIADSVNEFVESTKSIAGMTQRVREIADQTNLLALNAAIEAARAGEQGRGFAVVADEVRKLAENSSKSVSEIDRITQTLNTQSDAVVESVQHGQESLAASRQLVSTVSGMLAGATQSVTEASRDMNAIAESAKEQTEASNSIATSMEQIAQMVEKSSESAKEVAGAADRLQELAARLQASTLRFKLA